MKREKTKQSKKTKTKYKHECWKHKLKSTLIKALRLARIEHCSGTVVTPFLPSAKRNYELWINYEFLKESRTAGFEPATIVPSNGGA